MKAIGRGGSRKPLRGGCWIFSLVDVISDICRERRACEKLVAGYQRLKSGQEWLVLVDLNGTPPRA